MGHLSTSERVCSTTPMASTGEGSPPLLARRAKLSSEAQARRSEDSSPESMPRSKQQQPQPQQQQQQQQKSVPLSAEPAARNIPKHLIDYIPKDQINMEEYVRNFKGDNVLGWQFNAPLKWDKVIQITLLHLVAVFCLITYPVQDLRLYTVLWGKY